MSSSGAPKNIFRFLLTLGLTGAVPVVAHAAPLDSYAHVRILSHELTGPYERANSTPTLQRLTAALEASDTVVYLRCAGLTALDLDGRLLFLASSAHGLRYVIAEVSCVASVRRQVGTIAHELQHAVEVASHPEVTTAASMAAMYERIGWVEREVGGRREFDTVAARSAGALVDLEVRRAAALERAAARAMR